MRTRAALNYEERSSYSVTVKVNDVQRKNNSVAAKSVSITVVDRPESPSTPRAPTVTGVSGSTDSVRVTWDAPANPGPTITHYNLRYAVSGSRDAFTFADPPTGSADRSAIITGLTSGTRYQVQVRAWNAEGHSDWSSSGTGSPNPDVANRNPAFPTGALTFSVAENTAPSNDVGSLIAALDPDGDVLTYTLEGVDADSFDIIATNSAGQIQTKAALNFEEKASYSVAVRVRDGRGGTDAVSVTIRVTDVDEVPDTPFAPIVTTASSSSLSITWEAPENTGPPITDYDYRYMSTTDATWTEVTNTTIATTSAMIDGLTPSTSYDVEVWAKSAEGTSDWSNPGNGSTAAPGANSPPVFTEGATATRSVSATSPSGTLIGEPVAATDADTGDTLTYSLEGRDAPSFDIGETNGQLRTKSGITLIVGTTYTVIVAADDTRDIARITVSIEATAAPPNNPPVFSEGASATRSVASSAAAGTAIGRPVTATDADAGDALTYSLEGTDAASFDITPSTAQLRTRSGVTLSRSSYTVEVVASDTKGGTARITVTINVILNVPPEFREGTSTSRSVAENSTVGTSVGAPVTATDADQGDTVAYSLDTGADAGSFTISSSSGQISTAAALDYEAKNSYSVTVTATDRGGLTDTIAVTINVTDVIEVFGCATRGAVANASSNSGLVSDCEALLRSRNTLEDGGDRILNWSARRAIQDWDGIKLGGTPMRVVEVNLTSYRLAGTLPAELGSVSMLTAIKMRNNQLTGSIPPELNRLTRLETLLLHDNELSGTIPDLSNLTRLKWLWLSGRDMNLTGNLPSWLGRMSSLESVSLWGNNLDGFLPNLSGMTSIKELKLQSNRFRGDVPSWFADMRSLRQLYLHDNQFSGSIPSAFGRHTGLLRLWLDRNQLTGSIPAALGNMTNLKTLNLRDNRLSGTIPRELGNLSNLQQMRLHNNGLTGSIPTELSRLSNLIQLWVSGNQLSGSIPASLGGMSSLRDLNLRLNSLSGNIPSELGALSDTLTRLRIGGEIRDDGTRIRGNEGLTGCVPASLRSATDTDDLDLAGASGISICP